MGAPLIVSDTNLLAHLHILGPDTMVARSVFQRDPHWVAPVVWRYEFRNVLATYMRRDLLTLSDALGVAEEAESQLRGKEHAPGSSDVLALASNSGCTAYDCEFVVVARNLGVKLVTFDRALVSSFPGTAVSPAEFVKSGSR